MTWLLVALGLLIASGALAGVLGRARISSAVGVGGAVAAAVLGLVPAIRVLAGGPIESRSLPWHVPLASFTIELDALSAFFVVPILALSALAAIYGGSYLKTYE